MRNRENSYKETRICVDIRDYSIHLVLLVMNYIPSRRQTEFSYEKHASIAAL